MIKIFTSSKEPTDNQAGAELTAMISKWINALHNQIDILNIHTNSNKFGWMVVVHYKIIP